MAEANDKAVLECNDLGALAISLYKNAVPVVAMSQATDLPNGTDFGYSQKFFHIADGNLYSIFSPLQGRTYGVKPSFLKKQKYTIEECCGRGRNSVRKGLKFHNFLPSESVTSEVEDGNREEVWKTHAECRLREEHGTKQIMISHWSVSADSPSPLLIKDRNECSFPKQKDGKEHEHAFLSTDIGQGNVYNIQTENAVPLKNGNFESENIASTNAIPILSNNSLSRNQVMVQVPNLQQENLSITEADSSCDNKHVSLPFLMNENLCQNSVNGKQELSVSDFLTGNAGIKLSSTFNDDNDEIVPEVNLDVENRQLMKNYLCNSRKHRRKPDQTRRVVPYKKYLSLLEESESVPLDLSCHSNQIYSFHKNEFLDHEADKTVSNQESACYKSESLSSCAQKSHSVMSNYSTCGPQITGINAENMTNISMANVSVSPPLSKWPLANHLSNNFFPNVHKTSAEIKSINDVEKNLTSMEYKSHASINIRHNDISVASHGPTKTCTENTQSFTFGSDKNKLITAFSTQSNAKNLNSNLLTVPLSHVAKQNSTLSRSCDTNTLPSKTLVVKQTQACNPITKVTAPSFETNNGRTRSEQNNPFMNDFHLPRPHRKSNQRTIIRQKLEDAFRQNGFLVKTKQVSDGEATFCKFRQLRKYTRYYLKSWHNHLPEEVHKLWKGFLPPKTTLPPISSGRKANKSGEAFTKSS